MVNVSLDGLLTARAARLMAQRGLDGLFMVRCGSLSGSWLALQLDAACRRLRRLHVFGLRRIALYTLHCMDAAEYQVWDMGHCWCTPDAPRMHANLHVLNCLLVGVIPHVLGHHVRE